jgi:hypothetical protein
MVLRRLGTKDMFRIFCLRSEFEFGTSRMGVTCITTTLGEQMLQHVALPVYLPDFLHMPHIGSHKKQIADHGGRAV